MAENLVEKIRQKRAEIVSKYGSEKLDMSKLEGAESLEELKDAKQFLKEEPSNDKKQEDEQANYKGKDSSFKVEENEDGSFTARGSNGSIIKAPNFEELNRQVLSSMKETSIKAGKEPRVTFRSPNEDKRVVFAKSAVLEHGITIGKGSTVPQDMEFWKDLKNEYLEDKNHTEEEWNKMTRFVPDEVMGRTKGESVKNQKLIVDLDLKKKQSEQTKVVQPPKVPQKNNGNLLEEMLRRRQRGA
ncbi:MAG: hypothetical protein IJC30_04685 [Alphaproteobacteria bacterium]|nr:hypothetical protein [Alphaproteobacteria bacterium]